MAYSDVIIRQCGPRDADSDNDLRILWRMLKMMKTGFIRYLLAIIFMSAALSVFDMITALLFKNIIFRVENYAQRNMFAGLLKEVLLCAGIGCLMLFIYALSFYVYTMEAKKGGADLQKALYSKCIQSSNVEILPLKKKIDPAQVIVIANGQTISGIDEILDFGGY